VTGYSLPRLISDADDVATFDSGEPTLDDYLRNRALANSACGGSSCFVTCREGRVVGYYALAASSVTRAECPGKIRRNMPEPVPVILLSRLAVDRKEQGNGVGADLLRDAITHTIEAAEHIGVRAMVVHALHDDARQFYLHHGFDPSPTDELHLHLLIKDAKATLGI
jgi:GNAT superfamily N-acetyltransferase